MYQHCVWRQRRVGAQLKHCSDTSVVSRIEFATATAVSADTDKPSTVCAINATPLWVWRCKRWPIDEADAFVSAGNTGAMMALGLYYVKPLAGYLASRNLHRDSDINGSLAMCSIWAPISTARRSSSISLPLLGSLMAQELDNIASPSGRTAQCW